MHLPEKIDQQEMYDLEKKELNWKVSEYLLNYLKTGKILLKLGIIRYYLFCGLKSITHKKVFVYRN